MKIPSLETIAAIIRDHGDDKKPPLTFVNGYGQPLSIKEARRNYWLVCEARTNKEIDREWLIIGAQ